MKLSLVVLTPGKAQGQQIPITQSEFLIGRDPQCHLRPVSPIISKRHCALLLRDGKVFVRDFKSTNGTFVNGQQIDGELELKQGDKLDIGPLSLTIQLQTSLTPVDQRTPVPPTRAPGRTEEEDHAAALLLSLQDEVSTVQETASGPTEVPTGSTILEAGTGAPVPQGEKDKQAASKLEQVKKAQADTSSAASRILDKYIRRPRA
jgi:pSer/pThr/pTyr-binding forkhead associated (FHA) protein